MNIVNETLRAFPLPVREVAVSPFETQRGCGRVAVTALLLLTLALAAAACADSHVNVRGQYEFSAGYVKGLPAR
ncbi:MAG: hypothetical protein LBP38_00100 [Desulfovibrio sp.]|jgi:hypothetical protein|nr:hypothetical protein [Desulfovibrio sp.]